MSSVAPISRTVSFGVLAVPGLVSVVIALDDSSILVLLIVVGLSAEDDGPIRDNVNAHPSSIDCPKNGNIVNDYLHGRISDKDGKLSDGRDINFGIPYGGDPVGAI